jgi:hypothetical protein
MQDSEDAGNRNVLFYATRTGAQSLANLTQTPVQYNTIVMDKTAGWNGVDGWVVPETGTYVVNTFAEFSTSGIGARQVSVGGIPVDYIPIGNASYGSFLTGTYIDEFAKGYTIKINLWQNSGGALNSAASGGSYNYVQISKLASPQTIAASEKVYAEYTTTTPQTIGTSSVIVNYDTKVKDSHGAVTVGASWTFTAPRAGVYTISCQWSGSTTAGGNGTLWSTINAGGRSFIARTPISTGLSQYSKVMTVSIYLEKGQYVHNSAAAQVSTTLQTASGYNWITIISE